MNQHLFKLYNSIKFYLFGGEEIRQATEEDNGKIRHHKSIRDAGALLQDEALPLKQRLEAAHNLGVLGYTVQLATEEHEAVEQLNLTACFCPAPGGYEAANICFDFLPTMVDLLGSPERSDEELVLLLKALSVACYVHLRNQARVCSLGLLVTATTLLVPANPRSPMVRKWACHLLDVLCYNNVPALRALRPVPGLQASLERLEAEDWTHWPRNYAEILLRVLGFWPAEPSQEDDDTDMQ
ncbi:armadillo-like helical domain-containing protein 2 [Clupea harengus]|uniref:Armadillo-like helical domain-containing protein 2 n=1 Tax=Clupea harengus TaxID=7950 RepID=A0A8M1KVY1_CLUHA|nr:armadillo-like helical domain-containing protein 2 [Clupea harengus]